MSQTVYGMLFFNKMNGQKRYLKRLLQYVTLLLFSITNGYSGWCQVADTVKQLDEVVITGYLSRLPIVQVPASVAVLNSKALLSGSQQSLVPVINTVPGVRMEERSPGSYRLSIRGSVLRSPFGVRNVKLYLNDLPFTDASGNTYLNLIDPALLQRVEILKGPDGSLFGANSGGVVLLDTDQQDSSTVEGSISGGSYGLLREHVLVNKASKKIHWNFGEAFQRSDGYRQQTALKRLSLLGSGKLRYKSSNSIKLTVLFSDLHYETPGGLTKAQYEDDPKQARPAAGVVPGAVTQQAGIYNTTFFGGLTNELNLAPSLRHVVSIFGTITDFENPFITNYEVRHERNTGFRTFLKYAISKQQFQIEIHVGIESQFGFQKISNFANIGGTMDMFRISHDDIDVSQHIYFSKIRIAVAGNLTGEAAASLNQYSYAFKGIGRRNLSNQWMPRFALSYKLVPEFVVRASISKGYSPPTMAEIRPSGGVINENLQAETGWSKEVGTRLSIVDGRLQADVSMFRYDLKDAIVRRTNENDTEYFLNSGGTKQIGAEFLLNALLIPEQGLGFVRRVSVNTSYTYSRFTFDNYVSGIVDYSGNRLTGVPQSTVVAGLSMRIAQRIHVFVQSVCVSRIPLNDENSEYAGHYELLQAKIKLIGVKRKNLMLEFFAGADNLLNQQYSLGNDLNAFGGRYFNAAPLRNFYGGVNINF